MATAGLSFANPMLERMGVGEEPNPYVPYSPTSDIGMGGLAPSAADMAVAGRALVKQSQFTMPEMRQPPSIAFSPSSKQLFVNGLTFDADDAATALQSESYLQSPGTGLPRGGDWVSLDEQAYGQFLNSIKNPSMGRLASKSFGRGVDSMQMLAGRGLQLAGAEETGAGIVEQQAEDLRKTSPFERQFTDIGSAPNRGVVDWFVANFAQQGPNLIESIATAGAGFLAGTAVGGPAAGATAAFAGLLGKSAFKEAIKAAAQKKIAGEVLNAAENKLLREAAGLAGAVAASYAQNLSTGAADIYGELREQGADASDTDARLTALAGSIPYAALETLPEFLLAGRLFGGGGRAALPAGASRTARAGELLKRGAIGFGVGGTAEGLTEAGQEGLLLGISGQDLSSPESVDRLINSFAAGFGVGGPIGAVANLKGQQAANLLNPAQNPEQTPGTGLAVIPPTTPAAPAAPAGSPFTDVEFMGVTPPPSAELGGPSASTLQLPGPTPPVSPAGGPVIMAGMGPNAADVTRQDILLRQQGNVPPGAAPGSQGVLDIFGGTIPAQELAARMQPQQPLPGLPAPSPAAQPDPRQGALQFSGPAPTAPANTQMADQLRTIQDRVRRQREFEAAQAQQAALIQQQTDELARQSKNQNQNQQQLDIAEAEFLQQVAAVSEKLQAQGIASLTSEERQILAQAEEYFAKQQPAPQSMPMRQTGPTQPQQLPLFTRKQAPVPSRAEGLRRGVGTGLPANQIQTPLTSAQRRAQVPLFTQEGKPSVAALKSAGRKGQVAAVPDTTSKQAPPTGKPVTPASVEAAKGEALRRRGSGTVNFDNGDSYTGQLKNGVPNGQGTYTYADGSVYTGSFKDSVFDGQGKFVDASGTTFEGEFDNGDFLQPEETPSAVQKPSAKGVDVQKSTGTGKGVRGKDQAGGEVAGKGKALKAKTKEQEPAVPTVKKTLKKETPPSPKAVAAPAAALTETPDETWDAMDTGVAWTDLSAELQTRWTNSDRTQNTADTIAEDQRNPQTPEALWEDMKPEGAPAYNDLLPRTRTQWRQDVASNKATIPRAEELASDDSDETRRATTQAPADALSEAIATAETTSDFAEFRDAIRVVVNYAFFTGEETNTKKFVDQARAFIANTQFADAQMLEMDGAFLDAVGLVTKLEAAYKGGKNKGELKPWFNYAVSRNLMPSITAKIVNLPAVYKSQQSPVSGKIATSKPVETSADKITTTPQALLGALIDDLVTQARSVTNLNQQVKIKGIDYASIVEAAKALYAAVDAQGRRYIVRGYPLSDYFTDKGEPNILKSNERFLITNRAMTTAAQRNLEQEQKATAKSLAAQATAKFNEDRAAQQAAESDKKNVLSRASKTTMEWDSPDGMFYRDDGTAAASTVPVGRIRLLVNSFLSKLRIKPNTFIYANVADLKARNPSLFARAAAARKQGDFETTNAVGYSFGPNVIIFTDFVRTEQQLKFVLAHETLGHFGFKGVVPKAQLDAVLNRIYDIDPTVQAGVDAMLAANEGMSKLEAVEEFLADNAADLDTSIIARIWNVLKNFLNKLGFEFRDDEARYFVNQARKYVRRGDTGNFVSASAIAADMQQLDQDRNDGRYARYAAGDLASKAFAMGGLNKPYSAAGGLMGAAEAFYKNVFGQRRNVAGTAASILEQLQTLDNKARRSYGLNQLYRILEKQQTFARSLLSGYQRMTAFTHSADFEFFGGRKGASEEDKTQAGELLARAALLRSQQATDELIKKYPSLVIIDSMGNVRVDPNVRDEIGKAGFVTAEEFRKGFDITYSDGGKVRFQFDVDEASPAWKVYLELRETVNEAAIDMMMANYEAAQSESKRVISDLNAKRRGTNVFTQDDLAAIRRAAAMYQNMRYEGSDVANAGVEIKRKANKESEDFVVAFGRALFNDDVYAVWMKDPSAKPEIAKDLAEFQKAEYDDLRAALPSLREKVKTDNQSFVVQKAIRDLFLFDLQSKNADYYAKRTILGSYVPFSRRGSEQVKLVAVDSKGNPVSLDENVRSTLPYFQFNSRDEALTAAEELEAEFGGDNEWTLKDDAGNDIKVRFKAEVSKTRQSPDLTEAVNFNEFVYVLNRLNINLAPEARERIVTTLTNQNSRARRNLQRSGTEGWDKDVVRSVSEHLETSAHVAAKKLYRHRLDDILLNTANWLGDDQKLKSLKAAVDNATSDGERARASREYDEYAYMYRYMKATGKGNTVTIDGKEVPTLGRGEDYREEAKQVLRWYSESTNIADSTEDMLSGEAGSALKLLAVLMQLGGSVATAVINLASLATHSLPYLSYYNSARGFGGGYGETKSAAALWKAAGDLKNPKLSDAAFLNDLLRDANYGDYGLTGDEAQFLLDQTEAGTLQAAQFNALVGTARGKVFNNKAQAAIKLWMSMFSYTEQVNRRVTALAAYRLEKERLQSQGVTDEQQLIATATEAARNAVNIAQGEYAMFNRPEMARGNVLQYIFMYKQFVIVTVQLMKSMPVQGQLMMLGFLLLTSGLKGLPFAEDIFDIVDTIAQKLGLKTASVEKAIAEWVDSVAPGMTPYVMRGVLDRMTGATMSTRLGMGDLIPLTGAFRAGADPAREIADFAGPVFSGISGLVGMAGSLAKYGAEVTGLRDDTTSFNSILRDSPVAALRSIGDSYAYLNSGTITNARGQLVASEASTQVILARLLGFYPAIATEQNDIVRLSKNVAEYSKAIKAEYVSAYVKAKVAGDTGRMNGIAADVQQWNEDAKGTGLEITSFLRSANRAALEAQRPTVMRYLKSAPKQMRPETIELLRLNGLEDEVR